MIKEISKSEIKVLYLGTPEISATVLSALIASGYRVVGLVCQEDKVTGRKKELEEPATKKVALAHGIPVFQPHKIRLDYSFAATLDFDVIVTMAYGQIIPEGLLALAHKGNLNLHGSLLPSLRGAAPIQRSLMEGDERTGITLMEMVAEMDAGVAYDTEKVNILPSDNYTSLSKKMAEAAAYLIVRDLTKYVVGELKGIPQDQSKVTFAPKIKPEDEHLTLTLKCRPFVDYVRGLSEEPGAYLLLDGKKLKIYQSHVANDFVKGAPGTLYFTKKELLLQLVDGEVALEKVQLEGKKTLDAASFLNGAHLSEGLVLA
jgi:methionyl-tRNA formyltransferase